MARVLRLVDVVVVGNLYHVQEFQTEFEYFVCEVDYRTHGFH